MKWLRGWGLYVGLVLLTGALYGRNLLGDHRAVDHAEEPPARTTTQAAAPPELDVARLLQLSKERPGLLLVLAGWGALGVGIALTGLVLGVKDLTRARRVAHQEGLPYRWPLSEAGRVLLLVIVIVLLLPFVHMALSMRSLAWFEDAHAWSLVAMFLVHTVLLLVVWAFASMHGLTVRTMFGLQWPRAARAIGRSLRGYAVAFPWIFGLLALAAAVCERLGIEPPVEAIHELVFLDGRPWILAMTLLLACVIGPIAEEIIFRGILFSALRTRMSALAAMLISGSLFAAVHTNLIGFLPIVALGVLLADRYERTGSLAGPIAIHIAHNTLLMGVALTLKQLM